MQTTLELRLKRSASNVKLQGWVVVGRHCTYAVGGCYNNEYAVCGQTRAVPSQTGSRHGWLDAYCAADRDGSCAREHLKLIASLKLARAKETDLKYGAEERHVAGHLKSIALHGGCIAANTYAEGTAFANGKCPGVLESADCCAFTY